MMKKVYTRTGMKVNQTMPLEEKDALTFMVSCHLKTTHHLLGMMKIAQMKCTLFANEINQNTEKQNNQDNQNGNYR